MKTPTPIKRISHTMECLADKLAHFSSYQTEGKKQSSRLINRVCKSISGSVAPADSIIIFSSASESDSLSFLFYFQDECQPYVVAIIKDEKKSNIDISKKIPFDFFHSALKEEVKLSAVIDTQDLFNHFSDNLFAQLKRHKISSKLKESMVNDTNKINELDSELNAACTPFIEAFEEIGKPINQLHAEKEALITAELEKTSEYKALVKAKAALKKAEEKYKIKEEEIKSKLNVEELRDLQSRTLSKLTDEIEVAIINMGQIFEHHANNSTNGVNHALKLKIEQKISDLIAMYNKNSPLAMQGYTVYLAISAASKKFPAMISMRVSRIKNYR